MSPSSFFLHCPKCGSRQLAPPSGNAFECSACGFRLFFNPAGAVAVFITRPDGQMLFIVRAKDPGRGKLAPPGGFIDLGESAEAAVRRETREEIGLELTELSFICTHPNSYFFGAVTYPVLDIFFAAQVASGAQPRALDDVAAVRWLDPQTVAPIDLAFPSMQFAFSTWRNSRAMTR